MIEIRIIDPAHKMDIRIPNEPFPLWGRMIPSYENETWHYTVEEFAPQDISEMCFPDEDYDYDSLAGNHVFVGAYDGDQCVGLAVLADDWFKYMYLDDLKVCKRYRKQGVGKPCWIRRWRSRMKGITTVFTRSDKITISAHACFI